MSLVGWWQLEGDATDELGEHDGTVNGATVTTGKLGDALDFNGTSDDVVIENIEPISHLSISAWVYPHDSASRQIIAGESQSGNETMDLRVDSNGDLTCLVRDSTDYYRVNYSGWSTNTWYHLVGVFDSDNKEARLYVNGTLENSISTSNSELNSNSYPFIIGSRDYSGDADPDFYDGKIDDVRLYDHVLSEKEVKQLSRAKVLHYKMDTDGSVTDASGQGNDGTINGPTFTQDSAIGSGGYQFQSENNEQIDVTSPKIALEDEVTISLWANLGSNHLEQNSVIEANNSGNRILNIHFPWDNGNVYWDARNANNSDRIYKSINLSTYQGTWSHWVFTKNASTGEMKIYVDGNLWHSGTGQTGKMDTIDTMSVGSYAGGGSNYWDGKLDDVRVYSTELNEAEIQELYETRASIDAGGTTHAHELSVGERESFETGSFAPEWNVTTGTLSTTRSYHGNYSFGSWGDGGVEATWNIFEGERQIDSFEYVWKEDSSQSGHVVILYDGNGNEVQESGTENPQWYLNDGAGGRFGVAGYDGQGYNVWTRFRFDFDWDAGTYDYEMYDLDENVIRTGTTALDNATGVSEIRFTGAGYGSANYNRFDQLKINDNSIEDTGVFNSAEANEIGPAPESLVGWWPLDGNTNDLSENGNDGTNNGATVTSGLGQSAYDFEYSNTNEYIDLNSYILPSNEPFTVSCWCTIESNTNNWMRTVASHDGNSGIWVGFDGDGSENWQAGMRDTNGSSISVQGNGPSPPTNWQHLLIKWDGSTFEFYVNNNSLGTTSSSTFTSEGRNINIGRSPHYDEYWDGKIQGVRLYDRSLTSEEIAQLYAITDPRTDQQMMQTQDGRALAKEQFNELM